jgi:hypothetical protein
MECGAGDDTEDLDTGRRQLASALARRPRLAIARRQNAQYNPRNRPSNTALRPR